MSDPAHPLGVPLMDGDHASLEEMIARAETAPDAALERVYGEIAQELAAHFAREEALMRAQDFPGFHCHCAQHKILLGQAALRTPLAPAALRRHICEYVAQLVESHVLSMDYMTAAFLKGEFSRANFEGLRLPIEGDPA